MNDFNEQLDFKKKSVLDKEKQKTEFINSIM